MTLKVLPSFFTGLALEFVRDRLLVRDTFLGTGSDFLVVFTTGLTSFSCFFIFVDFSVISLSFELELEDDARLLVPPRLGLDSSSIFVIWVVSLTLLSFVKYTHNFTLK